ncbi:MAG: hypothetical protein E7040_05660 [Lentisphaerae bacterium]|nr:hypothetical protein [Lentisphaerota bacterium]
MKNRLIRLQDHCLQDGLTRYDSHAGLIGDYDPALYTPEQLKTRFSAEKFTDRSLHPYRDSVSFALCLLIMKKRSDFSALPEKFRNDPILKDSASILAEVQKILAVFLKNAPDPDGRLKWFLEEPKCCDGNGTFFSSAPLLLIEHYFANELPAEQLAEIRKVLKNTYAVFEKETHTGSWSYVNPTLGAYTFSALLSEKFYPEQFEKHLAEFEIFLNFLTNEGIAENYTTTYLLVDTMILLCAANVTENEQLRKAAKDFLDGVLFKEAAFFGDRFPAPYRRGYNGNYVTKRYDFLPFLFGWGDTIPENDRDPFLTMLTVMSFSLYLERNEINIAQEKQIPREITMQIHPDCHGQSYLNEKYLLGAFDQYPSRDNIVWQCVTVGGSGWQDGPVYATFENEAQTSLSLRLEAVDADGTFRCHPFEGEFTMEKLQKIYTWRSFPPEPKIRTILKQNQLLCLTKIDRVDAELRKLGFSLHFARFNGEVLDLNGNPVTEESAGAVIIRMNDIHAGLIPLKRVQMHGSSLWKCAGFKNDFRIKRKENILDLMMYNLDEETAELCTQNHVFGGFFLIIEQDCSTEEFIRKMNAVKISDESAKNRINAAIDLRDAIRTVKVETEDKNLEIIWDHYPW